MAIELSTLMFTEQDDIVPVSGVEEIVNTGNANTLGGNDLITGSTTGSASSYPIGILNSSGGIINTGTGHDIIIGICNHDHFIIPNAGIHNQGTINTEDGNDIIIGITQENHGIYLIGATINTGDGNDEITGIGDLGINVNGQGIIDTGNGNDTITGTGGYGIENFFIINTGDGNDKITGTGTFPGDYSYGLYNSGIMDTGAGNDEITGTNAYGWGISTYFNSTLDTGEGNDTITGTGITGIYNNGIIKTGDGKDSIIADGGFNGTGSVFLEEGEDYLKGFGSGNFNGGNGLDKVELTSGSYTVGISGTTVNFIKGSTIMKTSDFELLIAGNTTYRIRSLSEGQTIFVA